MYRRIGILSFSSPGHYYPLTALGRRLQSRGHDVVYFQVADLEKPIRDAGLRFRQIGEDDFPLGSLRARRGRRQARRTRRAALRHSWSRDEVADALPRRAGRDPR
jgi:UDP:flavonoid glycosyltransferase YjiC (YdhE family)